MLSRRDQRKRVKRRWKAPDEGGITREFEVEVKSAERLPWFRDNELLMVFITIAQREGEQEIGLSEYELLKWMGLTYGKENYEGLRASIDRLISVTLRGTLWEKNEGGGQWRQHVRWLHLVDAADLTLEKDPKTGVLKGQGLKIKLGDFIWNDIKSGNLLTFGWTEYRKLKGDSVKALYLYVQAIRVNRWEVDIFQLAETHLGMRHYKHPSRVWEKLKPILEAAAKQGVIHNYERVKHGKYTRVKLQKAPKQLSLLDDLPLEEILPDDVDHYLLEQLKERNIPHHKAAEIASDPHPDYEDRLEFYDDKTAGNNPPKDPVAYLIWLMRVDDFQFPKWFKSEKQKQAEAEERSRLQAADMAEKEAQQKQQRQIRETHLQALREQYPLSETLENIWSGVVNQIAALSQTGKTVVRLHLADSELLALDDLNKEAVIWIESQEGRDQVERLVGLGLRRLLASQLKIDVNDLNLIFLTPDVSPE